MQQPAPNRKTFDSIVSKFENIGSVTHVSGASRTITVSSPEAKELVATDITQSLNKFMRRSGQEQGLSYGSAWRILHSMN